MVYKIRPYTEFISVSNCCLTWFTFIALTNLMNHQVMLDTSLPSIVMTVPSPMANPSDIPVSGPS